MHNHSEPPTVSPNDEDSNPSFRILSSSTAKDSFSRMVYNYVKDEGTIGITIKELSVKHDLNYHTLRDHIKRLEQYSLIRKRNVGVYRDAKYVVVAIEGDRSIPYIPDFIHGKELVPLNKYWNAAINLSDGIMDTRNFPKNPNYEMIYAICHLVWAGECASEAIGEESLRNNPALARQWRIKAREMQQIAFEMLHRVREQVMQISNAAEILLTDSSLHTDKMRELYNMFIDVPIEYRVKRNHDTEEMVYDWQAINSFFENYMSYEMNARNQPDKADWDSLPISVAEPEPTIPQELPSRPENGYDSNPISFDPEL